MPLLMGARAPVLTPTSAAAVTARCERAAHSSRAARRLLTSADGGGGCGGCSASSGAHPNSSTPAVRQALTTLHRYRQLRRAVSLSYLPGARGQRLPAGLREPSI